ncbi:MAG TPA: hypothetical protein VFX89_08375 [Gammaproteobacteria bacterium]|nr:hypothetical protein [Gammaproteobacteria bacterium]
MDRESQAPVGASGSLEDAVSGNYEFSIGDIMSEAWSLLPGFKGPMWGAVLLIYLLFFLAGLVLVFALTGGDGPPSIVWLQIFNGILGVIMMPLIMGVVALGVRHASGLPVSFTMAFGYLRKAPVLIGAALLVTLLTYLGIALLILPGIYLGLAYGMTLPLLMFNDLGIWRAMETSRRAITHHWFGFFGLYIVMGVLVGLSALLLLIPLIWTLPWAVLVAGVAYRRMFGVPAAAE